MKTENIDTARHCTMTTGTCS